MKYLVFLAIIALCSGVGYSALGSSGVVCKIDEEGHSAECDEENSQIPSDLNTNAAVATDEYICLDVTYRTGFILKKNHHVLQCAHQLKGQRLCSVLKNGNDVSKCIESTPDPKPVPTTTTPEPASGLYCTVDDVDNTVECTKSNSILPKDLKDGDEKKKNEYVCVDVTYKTGLIPLLATHHVRQCALQLSNGDLCDVLEDNNIVQSCTQAPPYTSPTIIPPSGLYCTVDSDGDKVQCSKANSLLPSDLNIGFATLSSNHVCVSVSYKTGIFPLEKTHSTQQCAYDTSGDQDLCTVLRNNNNVQKCRLFNPSKDGIELPARI